MADNVAITAGTGTNIVTDDISNTNKHYQRVKLSDGTADSEVHLKIVAEDGASADGDTGIIAMARRTDAPATTTGTDGDYEALQVSGGRLWVSALGFPFRVSTDVTRPADSTQYAAGDAISDSTSSPTSGGFTLTGVARKSGGSAMITDVIVTTSADAATRLSGEVFFYNQAATNVNDNSAYAVSDPEIKTLEGVVPFSLFDSGNNGAAHISGLNMIVTCVGSADLRFHLRARNAYTPTSAEVITVIVKGFQLD